MQTRAAICLFVRPSDSLLKLYPLFALVRYKTNEDQANKPYERKREEERRIVKECFKEVRRC